MNNPRIRASSIRARDVAWFRMTVQHGGCLCLPTDTVYGLCCSLFSAAGIRKVVELKNRVMGKPSPVLFGSLNQVLTVCELSGTMACHLAKMHWPGPLTLVLPVRKSAAVVEEGVAPDGTLGVRIPALGWLRNLIKRMDVPLMATSANQAGDPPIRKSKAAFEAFGRQVDGFIDGRCPIGVPSTVVSVIGDRIQILRQGALALDHLTK